MSFYGPILLAHLKQSTCQYLYFKRYFGPYAFNVLVNTVALTFATLSLFLCFSSLFHFPSCVIEHLLGFN